MLLTNPPWETERGYGIRSNSRWPHIRPDKHLQFPIYLAYAASVLEKAGHQVRVIDAVAEEMTAGTFLEAVRGFNPDIVFMETATPSFKQDINNALAIKKAGFPVYLFGTHVSVFYKQVLEQNTVLDGCIRGEFEYTIRNIANGQAKDEILGLAYWDDQRQAVQVNPDADMISNLDDLPFPDRKLFNLAHYQIHLDPQPSALLVASRGCPHGCTYCIWPQTLYGHKHRMRSPQNICDELEMLIQNYRIVFFRFDDDVFLLNPKQVIAFCEEFLKRGLEKRLKWACFGHVNSYHEDMYKMLARAGCCRIDFGIETGSEKILKIINKNISIEKAKQTFRACRSRHIRTFADFMIGFPHETKEDIQKSIDLAIDLDPDYIQISYVVPVPGSQMYFDGIDKGHIDPDLPFEKYDSTGQVINTKDITAEELKHLYNKFWKKFYLRPRFISRELLRALSSPREFKRVTRGFMSFYKRVFGKNKL